MSVVPSLALDPRAILAEHRRRAGTWRADEFDSAAACDALCEANSRLIAWLESEPPAHAKDARIALILELRIANRALYMRYDQALTASIYNESLRRALDAFKEE